MGKIDAAAVDAESSKMTKSRKTRPKKRKIDAAAVDAESSKVTRPKKTRPKKTESLKMTRPKKRKIDAVDGDAEAVDRDAEHAETAEVYDGDVAESEVIKKVIRFPEFI